MVHTLPPWTTKYRMVKVFGQIDSGELAARLNPLNTFDRRGNVIYYDRCNESLGKWSTGTTGAGASITLSTTRPYLDDASIKMVGGSDSTRRAYLIKSLPQVHTSRIGVEYLFHISYEIDNIELLFAMEEATKRNRGQIKLDILNNKIYYTESVAENWTWLADYEFSDAATMFHSVKLVIDHSTNKYVRLVLPHHEYDLSALSLNTNLASYTGLCQTRFRHQSTDGKNGVLYLGGFIFTHNED